MNLPPKHTPNALGLVYNISSQTFIITECYLFEDNWENATKDVVLPDGSTNFYVVQSEKDLMRYEAWNPKHILIGNEQQLQKVLNTVLNGKITQLKNEIKDIQEKINKFEKQRDVKPKAKKWKDTQISIMKQYLSELESN